MSLRPLAAILLTTLALACAAPPDTEQPAQGDYQSLVALFDEFLEFERPAMVDGAPDYTAPTLAAKLDGLADFETRLNSMSTDGWSVDQQVDHALVRAQMNGFSWYLRVLQPWARDPAFYKSVWTSMSDTPEHEGPTHHAVLEVWEYDFPLSDAEAALFLEEVNVIAPLMAQAQGNLTGNARDLWITGVGTMQQQASDLENLAARVGNEHPALATALAEALAATEDLVAWLESQASSKTGPSGLGKDQYTWGLQNVHLIPMTWEDEVALLRRELDRAHSALRQEEHRNRNLPPLEAAADAAEFAARADAAATKFLAFLDEQEVLPMEDYLDPALRAHLGSFAPEERRNFFSMATHFEPVPLYSHFYHWFDHAWMRNAPHPSPVRQKAWLYNVWDSRSEGMATAFEEIVMHAGYYDDNPRGREIVWIMLAQRAARGLASLYAHANEFDIAQAKAFQVEWTPRGWMKPELDLLGFEQQLYLRQPGYGTSYVTGKALIDDLLRARANQLGDEFTLRGFFDDVNKAGMIPVSLLRWQLTGEAPGPR